MFNKSEKVTSDLRFRVDAKSKPSLGLMLKVNLDKILIVLQDVKKIVRITLLNILVNL